MANKQQDRQNHEKGMLNDIGGHEEPAPEPAAPVASVSIGWMGYVGGVLWVSVLGVGGLIAWLAFKTGG